MKNIVNGKDGKEYEVQTMILKDADKVGQLYQKIDLFDPSMNLPVPNEDGSYNAEAYDSLITIVMMALSIKKSEVKANITLDTAMHTAQIFIGYDKEAIAVGEALRNANNDMLMAMLESAAWKK